MGQQIKVLDHGSVELVDWMGDDLRVANAARASMQKYHEQFTPADARLLAFLAKSEHTSPFRHAVVTVAIEAPLREARQFFKHRIGGDHTGDSFEHLGEGNGDDGGPDISQGRNEASRRYVTLPPIFHVPTIWRGAPANAKQGSAGQVADDVAAKHTRRLREIQQIGLAAYEDALADGVAAEQARLFLPAYGMYTHWWWTASLAGMIWFLQLRLHETAQSEIREYARAIATLVEPHFPETFKVFGLSAQT